MSGLLNSIGGVSGILGTTSAPSTGTATDGYVLTATGAGVNPAWEAAGGGGLDHIITNNLPGSDSTGSIFATFNDNTYSTFHVIMKDIELVNDAVEWRFTFTDSGGGQESGNGYWTSLLGWTSSDSEYRLALQPQTYIRMCPNLGSATGEVFNGMFTMSGMRNTAVFATITGSLSWYHGGNYLVTASFAGGYSGNATTAFHGFQLDSTSGNFAGGNISVYGYKIS